MPSQSPPSNPHAAVLHPPSQIALPLYAAHPDGQPPPPELVFDALGPNGIFINLGRGNSVEENDLINAVTKKKIKLACLDVYKNEPHISGALRSLENVILLPHIGSATVETRTKMGDLVIRNIEAFLENEQLVSEVFA